MLNFNHSGLLVPDTKIRSTIDELEKEFVTGFSAERRQLFNSYLDYSQKLKHVCGEVELMQWINGSFVTKKLRPNDIDLVTFIDHEIVSNAGALLDSFKFPHSQSIYNVDAYIVPVYKETHPKNYFYISNMAYWSETFGKTKRNNRGNKLAKGYLEIFL